MKSMKSKKQLPFVIYIFTITAFALGLAEFVPIGITDVMAKELSVNIEQIGGVVAAYALGATFAAPILTALTNGWSRKKVMLITVLIFSLGSLVAAFADNLMLMNTARFFAGVGHGLFLAVASSTAAKLAGSDKAGTAVAIVFGGFTIAMAIGVPASTYLGNVMDWRLVLALIGVFGAIGFFGLWGGMKNPIKASTETKVNIKSEILSIFNIKLLSGALVTVFAYAGSFAAYTYIASLLIDVASVNSNSIPVFTLLFGIFAAIGNFAGGMLTDKLGINRSNIYIITGIGFVTLFMTFFAHSAIVLGILVSLLGFFTFASVPALQARLISIAERHTPNSHGVAAGLNIAGFNSAIAVGAIVGGLVIKNFGISYTGLVGALLTFAGLGILLFQIKSTSKKYSESKIEDERIIHQNS